MPSLENVPLEPFYSLDISPRMGRQFMATLIDVLSYLFQVNYYQVFIGLDIFCGCMFILLGLIFIHRNIKNLHWKLVLGIIGLTAPFLQVFFGHIEMYAVSLLLLEVWVMLLIYSIETRRKWVLYLLIPLLLIGIKVHPTFMLLIPAWLMVFLAQNKVTAKFSEKLFTLKGVGIYILTPVFLLGFILYFFILGDHNDPRALTGVQDFERLFLPIITPEAPLDRYNLQSFNHIFDFANVLLLWSPAALVLLLFILIGHRKKVNWQKPSILLLLLTLVIYTAFLFAVNPLLSMPIDWDLFVIPAPLLLILIALLVREIETKNVSAAKALPIAVAFALLSTSFFAVNTLKEPYSRRLESLSIRIFKTYHIWADKYLKYAINDASSRIEGVERNEAVIAQLKPYAVAGNDLSYAQMLYDNGNRYLNFGDIANANKNFAEANYYYPQHELVLLNLLQTNFQVGKFQDAYINATQLVELKHPSEEKSIRMAIHCTLAAEKYEEALSYSEKYLELAPNDSTIIEVKDRLSNGENIDEIINLFASPKKTY